MTEPKRQSDIALLTPIARERVQGLLNLCKRNKLNVAPFETLRSLERQQWLYAKGRTRDIGSKPVTWTLKSNHLTGNACDLVFLTPKGQPTWEGNWKKVIELATKYCSLKSLAPVEQCHFELP